MTNWLSIWFRHTWVSFQLNCLGLIILGALVFPLHERQSITLGVRFKFMDSAESTNVHVKSSIDVCFAMYMILI